MTVFQILILVFAWITPGLAILFYLKKNSLWIYTEVTGSIITLLLLGSGLIWFRMNEVGTLIDWYGLSPPTLYLVIIGYFVLGGRAFIRAGVDRSSSATWSFYVLVMLAAFLTLLIVNIFSIVAISWLVISYCVYKLITYKNFDLDIRQDYRERVNKEYIDRF